MHAVGIYFFNSVNQRPSAVEYCFLREVPATAHTNEYAGQADKHRMHAVGIYFFNSVNQRPSAVKYLFFKWCNHQDAKARIRNKLKILLVSSCTSW